MIWMQRWTEGIGKIYSRDSGSRCLVTFDKVTFSSWPADESLHETQVYTVRIKLSFFFFSGVVIYVSAKKKILPWPSPTDQRNKRLTGNATSTICITVDGLFVSLG